MLITKIAEKIADNPGIDYAFRRASWPAQLVDVEWRHPTWNDQYRSLWVGGDQFTPSLADLIDNDWEFVKPC